MYFVKGDINGAEQRLRYAAYNTAVSVAKRLRNGEVTDESGEVVWPKKDKVLTPRWVKNPRYWNEDVTISHSVQGITNEDDYRESVRALYVTMKGVSMDLASVVWVQNKGQLPPNYWVRHKDRDVTNNALENLELVLSRDYYDYRIPANLPPFSLPPMSQKKFREWFDYDEDTGVLFIKRPYISLYGVKDASGTRPMARERGDGRGYDIATNCYLAANGSIPSFRYVGFKDLSPNNLKASNLVLCKRPYNEDNFRNDYELQKDGYVHLKQFNVKVMTWPLVVPGSRLTKTFAKEVLRGKEVEEL